MKKRMDENSLFAWRAKRTQFDKRKQDILATMGAEALTVRQIKDKMGMQDMNDVRPRITELLQMGVLEKAGKSPDPITGVPVMIVRRAMPASATATTTDNTNNGELQL